MVSNTSLQMLTGRECVDLVEVPQRDVGSVKLHREVAQQFARLYQSALKNNYDMRIISGYRSYDRQLDIWNGKVNGARALLGCDGELLNREEMSPSEIVFAILRWSALPGGSRHHWGTDLDVIDARSLPEKYHLKLVPAEFSDNEIFGSFRQWLDNQISDKTSFGFFRPYNVDRGGVSPEPWHLSYAPLSLQFQRALTRNNLENMVKSSNMLLKDVVIEHFDEIFEKFVCVPEDCYPPS